MKKEEKRLLLFVLTNDQVIDLLVSLKGVLDFLDDINMFTDSNISFYYTRRLKKIYEDFKYYQTHQEEVLKQYVLPKEEKPKRQYVRTERKPVRTGLAERSPSYTIKDGFTYPDKKSKEKEKEE